MRGDASKDFSKFLEELTIDDEKRKEVSLARASGGLPRRSLPIPYVASSAATPAELDKSREEGRKSLDFFNVAC